MKELCSSILELRVTSPLRAEFSAHDQGVAVLIFNTKAELLLLQEAEDDATYGRKKGHFNILTETREKDELLKATIARGLDQELGIGFEAFAIVPQSYRETNGNYMNAVGYQYKYRCVCLLYRGDPNPPAHTIFHSPTGEIDHHQWVAPDSLDGLDMEMGARIVIESYCREISLGIMISSL